MANISELRFHVLSRGKTVPWWWRIAYLIPDIFKTHPELEGDFTKVFEGKDTAFRQFVEKHLQAYIEKGTLPPAAIVGPIVNIAEDVMAGREPVIRAGDYIAIQNQIRSGSH